MRAAERSGNAVVGAAVAIMVATIGFAAWQFVTFPWQTVEAVKPAPVPPQLASNVTFAPVHRWGDIGGWKTYNLRVGAAAVPGVANETKSVELIEDTTNTWRNIQTDVSVTREKPIKITVDIKAATADRHLVIMLFAGSERFSCSVSPATGATATQQRGKAVSYGCAAQRRADEWWRVELTGFLSRDSASDPAFLAIALAQDGFREDYQGDGRSGVYVGAAAIMQAAGGD